MSYNLPYRTPHSTPISRGFTQSVQKDRCNDNGNAVGAFSPSSSESSLVSPMQTSVHDNDLSSNSKSKATSSRPEVFCKKGVLKNFAKFTVKHSCQSLFLVKLLKKETLAQVFSCGFCEIVKNTSFDITPPGGRLRKAKRERKGIINEKQWRSDEIMQLISTWEKKEKLYNAASPNYSIRFL